MFKCMKGAVAENGKFIMPLSEKLTVKDSIERCESQGFTVKLNGEVCIVGDTYIIAPMNS